MTIDRRRFSTSSGTGKSATALTVLAHLFGARASERVRDSVTPRGLTENPQLDKWVVHDLNREPRLSFAESSFDAVACAVSVQYLLWPIEVFADVYRVLVAGGLVVVSFSNRCFPTKAVMAWLGSDDAGHRGLVRAYIERAGFEDVVDERVSTPDDPLFVVRARR